IATAIRESLELGVILQKTVDEVGTALNVASCALRVEGQTAEQALTYFYFDDESEAGTTERYKIIGDLDLHCSNFADQPDVFTQDGGDDSDSDAEKLPSAVAQLIFHKRLMRALQVTSSDSACVWQENEIMLLR